MTIKQKVKKIEKTKNLKLKRINPEGYPTIKSSQKKENKENVGRIVLNT